jgi:hypothetical protein
LGVIALIGVLLAMHPVRMAAADAGCTGKKVVQQAPYSCSTTRTIDGVEVTADLDVDANGRAVVTFTISPPQAVDLPVTVHNYTGIGGEPRQFVDGVIVAGTTTTTLVVEQVTCGQFDMKAVHTRAGDRRGHVAGPVLSWGQNCTVPTSTPPPTTAPPTAPTSAAPVPSTAAPVRVAPATVRAATLPPTGSGSAVPWPVATGMIAVGVAVLIVTRRAGPHAT